MITKTLTLCGWNLKSKIIKSKINKVEAIIKLENAVIRAGLARYGSISEAAKHFQVDRSTIFRKVKEMEGQKTP